MEKSISAETVEKTWKAMASTQVDDAPILVERMSHEQPALVAYLMAADDSLFDMEERELIFYIGMVTWQIMKKSPQRLGKVSEKKVMQAEEANYTFLEELSGESDGDFFSLVKGMIEDYSEPEVLRYVIEAIMEESDNAEEAGFQEENKGMAFVHLKTVLDAMVNSLKHN